MLVVELPDDLLDHVLEGDDTGRAAVLIGDHRNLKSPAAQLFEQDGSGQCVRDATDGTHQVGGGAGVARIEGDRERVFDVHHADDVVRSLVDYRETGVTRLR